MIKFLSKIRQQLLNDRKQKSLFVNLIDIFKKKKQIEVILITYEK